MPGRSGPTTRCSGARFVGRATDNFSLFDFGRTDLDNEGLRTFKANWGTVETELVYSTLGDPPAARTNSTTGRALGAVIRHSPEFVCRELGERLYRYAA